MLSLHCLVAEDMFRVTCFPYQMLKEYTTFTAENTFVHKANDLLNMIQFANLYIIESTEQHLLPTKKLLHTSLEV